MPLRIDSLSLNLSAACLLALGVGCGGGDDAVANPAPAPAVSSGNSPTADNAAQNFLGGLFGGADVGAQPDAGGNTGGLQNASMPTETTPVADAESDDLGSFSAEPEPLLNLADLVEKVEPSVVRLDVKGDHGGGVGSGYVVDARGIVITNFHVIRGGNEAEATFENGNTAKVLGVLQVDPDRDIAVLKVDLPPNTPALDLGPGNIRKGETVVAFGAPKGLSFTASNGIITGFRTAKELKEFGAEVEGEWLQTNAPISPGNSGGPLCNTRGQVVGMNTMVLTTGQNLNFAVSAADIKQQLQVGMSMFEDDKLETLAATTEKHGGAKTRTFASSAGPTEDATQKEIDEVLDAIKNPIWFGAVGTDISRMSDREKAGVNVPTNTGIHIDDVVYRSPAYEAGMRKGDVIKKVDGNLIDDADTFERLLDKAVAGRVMVVDVLNASSGRRPRLKEMRILGQHVIPTEAIEYVRGVKAPIIVHRYLAGHLKAYGDFLTAGSFLKNLSGQFGGISSEMRRLESATRDMVDDLLEDGPFQDRCAPVFGRHVRPGIGQVGSFGKVRIGQVIDDKLAVIAVDNLLVACPMDARDLYPGQEVNMGAFQIVDTAYFQTNRGQIKAFIARPFDMEEWVPKQKIVRRDIASAEKPAADSDSGPKSTTPAAPSKAEERESAAESKYNLAKKFYDRGSYATAKSWLNRVVRDYPDTGAAAKAKALLRAIP